MYRCVSKVVLDINSGSIEEWVKYAKTICKNEQCKVEFLFNDILIEVYAHSNEDEVVSEYFKYSLL